MMLDKYEVSYGTVTKKAVTDANIFKVVGLNDSYRELLKQRNTKAAIEWSLILLALVVTGGLIAVAIINIPALVIKFVAGVLIGAVGAGVAGAVSHSLWYNKLTGLSLEGYGRDNFQALRDYTEAVLVARYGEKQVIISDFSVTVDSINNRNLYLNARYHVEAVKEVAVGIKITLSSNVEATSMRIYGFDITNDIPIVKPTANEQVSVS